MADGHPLVAWARAGAASSLGAAAERAERVAERVADGARTARFLGGKLAFRVRSDDLFISSYPRSGTTWLQQIALVLCHDGEPACTHVSELSPWFERNLALGRRTAADLDRLPSPRIFKSHLPFAWLPRGARYVYTVRDGRDVAVSYYHLYRSHLGFEGDFDAFFERFLGGHLQYGSWFKHVQGWHALAGRPDVLLLSYERMCAELPVVMAELSRFLGLARSPGRIAELAELCTFAHMKAHEDRFDHATEERALRGGMTSGVFVRRGESGGYVDYFGERQLARFGAAGARRHRHPGFELNLPVFLH